MARRNSALVSEGSMYLEIQPPDDAVVPLQLEVHDTAWWYYAAFIESNWPQRATSSTGSLVAYGTEILPKMRGYTISGIPGHVHIVCTDTTTTITIKAVPEFVDRWHRLMEETQRLARNTHDIRRRAVGQTFQELLDNYYAAKDRGERPKLKAMAEAEGVNYDSLRQAKIRYDAERRKNASDD